MLPDPQRAPVHSWLLEPSGKVAGGRGPQGAPGPPCWGAGTEPGSARNASGNISFRARIEAASASIADFTCIASWLLLESATCWAAASVFSNNACAQKRDIALTTFRYKVTCLGRESMSRLRNHETETSRSGVELDRDGEVVDDLEERRRHWRRRCDLSKVLTH
jgi:hypothetical protein